VKTKKADEEEINMESKMPDGSLLAASSTVIMQG
jgi:hypothetical protein